MDYSVQVSTFKLLASGDASIRTFPTDIIICNFEVHGSIFRFREVTYEKPIPAPLQWGGEDDSVACSTSHMETETVHERSIEHVDYQRVYNILESFIEAKNENSDRQNPIAFFPIREYFAIKKKEK